MFLIHLSNLLLIFSTATTQAQIVDLENKAAYAAGVFTQGGFEKIVEINSQHPDYVMFAVSGYTGAFGCKYHLV